jgi:lipoprotein-anchoring transpeptidase ErfK/SrfK
MEIHLEKQVLIAYEWDRPVFTARIASGARFSTGNYETPIGRFVVFHKMPSRHMAAGDIASNGYDLPGVPWVSYFTEEGISIHGTYWHNDFGKKRSHGCINLTPQAAKWIYRWTQPVVPPSEKRVYEKTGTLLDILPY